MTSRHLFSSRLQILQLYFPRFVTHFKRSMTRPLLNIFALPLLFLLAAQNLLHADTTNTALARSVILENDVAYLRVSHVEKNLADEIQSAQDALATTNKISGTILDLRFAGGGDLESSKAAAGLFGQKKLPLAILVNNQT